ncbi:nnp-1 protein putative nuclear protein 1 nop52 [Anaeramoeba flamelloides]|uniref:Nnp-1 protein putative nuclear protein 1 nop52 n=1 Tax=Anaeramoeba flamelloides TaxID=1746091 RepID=A0AAV8A411_9EUKA|nr:nnp-1 protein putative nuclear protein 1 nop52 [Anaeramoeba flamelloides]
MNTYVKTWLSIILEENIIIRDSLNLSVYLCQSLNKLTPNCIKYIDRNDQNKNVKTFLQALKQKGISSASKIINWKNLLDLKKQNKLSRLLYDLSTEVFSYNELIDPDIGKGTWQQILTFPTLYALTKQTKHELITSVERSFVSGGCEIEATLIYPELRDYEEEVICISVRSGKLRFLLPTLGMSKIMFSEINYFSFHGCDPRLVRVTVTEKTPIIFRFVDPFAALYFTYLFKMLKEYPLQKLQVNYPINGKIVGRSNEYRSIVMRGFTQKFTHFQFFSNDSEQTTIINLLIDSLGVYFSPSETATATKTKTTTKTTTTKQNKASSSLAISSPIETNGNESYIKKNDSLLLVNSNRIIKEKNANSLQFLTRQNKNKNKKLKKSKPENHLKSKSTAKLLTVKDNKDLKKNFQKRSFSNLTRKNKNFNQQPIHFNNFTKNNNNNNDDDPNNNDNDTGNKVLNKYKSKMELIALWKNDDIKLKEINHDNLTFQMIVKTLNKNNKKNSKDNKNNKELNKNVEKCFKFKAQHLDIIELLKKYINIFKKFYSSNYNNNNYFLQNLSEQNTEKERQIEKEIKQMKMGKGKGKVKDPWITPKRAFIGHSNKLPLNANWLIINPKSTKGLFMLPKNILIKKSKNNYDNNNNENFLNSNNGTIVNNLLIYYSLFNKNGESVIIQNYPIFFELNVEEYFDQNVINNTSNTKINQITYSPEIKKIELHYKKKISNLFQSNTLLTFDIQILICSEKNWIYLWEKCDLILSTSCFKFKQNNKIVYSSQYLPSNKLIIHPIYENIFLISIDTDYSIIIRCSNSDERDLIINIFFILYQEFFKNCQYDNKDEKMNKIDLKNTPIFIYSSFNRQDEDNVVKEPKEKINNFQEESVIYPEDLFLNEIPDLVQNSIYNYKEKKLNMKKNVIKNEYDLFQDNFLNSSNKSVNHGFYYNSFWKLCGRIKITIYSNYLKIRFGETIIKRYINKYLNFTPSNFSSTHGKLIIDECSGIFISFKTFEKTLSFINNLESNIFNYLNKSRNKSISNYNELKYNCCLNTFQGIIPCQIILKYNCFLITTHSNSFKSEYIPKLKLLQLKQNKNQQQKFLLKLKINSGKWFSFIFKKKNECLEFYKNFKIYNNNYLKTKKNDQQKTKQLNSINDEINTGGGGGNTNQNKNQNNVKIYNQNNNLSKNKGIDNTNSVKNKNDNKNYETFPFNSKNQPRNKNDHYYVLAYQNDLFIGLNKLSFNKNDLIMNRLMDPKTEIIFSLAGSDYLIHPKNKNILKISSLNGKTLLFIFYCIEVADMFLKELKSVKKRVPNKNIFSSNTFNIKFNEINQSNKQNAKIILYPLSLQIEKKFDNYQNNKGLVLQSIIRIPTNTIIIRNNYQNENQNRSGSGNELLIELETGKKYLFEFVDQNQKNKYLNLLIKYKDNCNFIPFPDQITEKTFFVTFYEKKTNSKNLVPIVDVGTISINNNNICIRLDHTEKILKRKNKNIIIYNFSDIDNISQSHLNPNENIFKLNLLKDKEFYFMSFMDYNQQEDFISFINELIQNSNHFLDFDLDLNLLDENFGLFQLQIPKNKKLLQDNSSFPITNIVHSKNNFFKAKLYIKEYKSWILLKISFFNGNIAIYSKYKNWNVSLLDIQIFQKKNNQIIKVKLTKSNEDLLIKFNNVKIKNIFLKEFNNQALYVYYNNKKDKDTGYGGEEREEEGKKKRNERVINNKKYNSSKLFNVFDNNYILKFNATLINTNIDKKNKKFKNNQIFLILDINNGKMKIGSKDNNELILKLYLNKFVLLFQNKNNTNVIRFYDKLNEMLFDFELNSKHEVSHLINIFYDNFEKVIFMCKVTISYPDKSPDERCKVVCNTEQLHFLFIKNLLKFNLQYNQVKISDRGASNNVLHINLNGKLMSMLFKNLQEKKKFIQIYHEQLSDK